MSAPAHICPHCGRQAAAPFLPPTEKMLACARVIAVWLVERGVAPSYDELRAAMGLHSKSGIHRLVGQLERRGWALHGNGARSLALTPAAWDHLRSLDERKAAA